MTLTELFHFETQDMMFTAAPLFRSVSVTALSPTGPQNSSSPCDFSLSTLTGSPLRPGDGGLPCREVFLGQARQTNFQQQGCESLPNLQPSLVTLCFNKLLAFKYMPVYVAQE